MPSFEFKGKPFVYAHHFSVPFRELVLDTKNSLPPKGQKPPLDDNLIRLLDLVSPVSQNIC
jgi:adenine-specific DNA-methyltransferase